MTRITWLGKVDPYSPRIYREGRVLIKINHYSFRHFKKKLQMNALGNMKKT